MSAGVEFKSAGDAGAFWLLSDKVIPRIEPRDNDGAFTLYEVQSPPGSGPPPHIHHREDEAFYVLDGEYTFLRGDSLIRARPGSMAVGVRDIVHTFKNTSTGWSRMLVMIHPGAFDSFAKQLADPSGNTQAPPTVTRERIDALMALCPKFGIDMKPDHPMPADVIDAPPPAEAFSVFGMRVDLLCSGRQSGDRFMIARIAVPPGGGPPAHLHRRSGEGFYFLDGEFELTIGDRVHRATKGCSAFVSPGVPHRFRNCGTSEGSLLSYQQPAGFEQFFRLTGTPAGKSGQAVRPDDLAISAALRACDTEIVAS